MEDKVERFKKAVEYFSSASKPRPLSMGPSPYLWFGPVPFGSLPGHMGAMQPGKNQVGFTSLMYSPFRKCTHLFMPHLFVTDGVKNGLHSFSLIYTQYPIMTK
uniref:Uncharacterized protein n=1 Tax=Hucho hucho TaxID=62062 RepID=A0A4W5KFL4_9TELE